MHRHNQKKISVGAFLFEEKQKARDPYLKFALAFLLINLFKFFELPYLLSQLFCHYLHLILLADRLILHQR
jgi:hypothetical protein